MGEHTRKRKAVAVGDEISVTELEAAGARMRAPTTALSKVAAAKSRRIRGGGGDSNRSPMSSCGTCRRSTVAAMAKDKSSNNAGLDRNSTPTSNEEPEACYPTNGSSSWVVLDLDGRKFVEKDKKVQGEQANCWMVGRGLTNPERPTEAELEEFFAEAEKECTKRFIEKYNYDIVNDVPLEGPYEWTPIDDTPPLSKKI